jgi:enoyl-CoA hydratase/carnithine racemase
MKTTDLKGVTRDKERWDRVFVRTLCQRRHKVKAQKLHVLTFLDSELDSRLADSKLPVCRQLLRMQLNVGAPAQNAHALKRESKIMQTHPDDYFAAYRSLRLTRDAGGVMVAEFHSNGGPFTFTAQDHTEFVDAFYRIGQDRMNKIVILTGAGGEFIPEINFSSFGNVADPGVWSQVHDEGVQILENIANIRVPMIAAIEGRAHVHSEYALLANLIVAAEGATFHDIPHFAGGIVPGDGIFTTWSYRAGAGRAEAFLLQPHPLAARTAHEWGVVAEVVPSGKTLSRARELAELYLKAPEVTRRNTRIHFIQPLKERIVREVGYGLSLEGASAADLVKSMQARSEPVAQKGKVA